MQGNMNERFPAVVKRIYQDAKVGAASGWTVRAGADSFMATCAASQTNATLIVPLTGLEVGDRIVGFHMNGQIESGGNAVNFNIKLASSIPVAAGSTHSAVTGTTGNTITKAADTALNEDNTKFNLPESAQIVVESGKAYFAIVTATTLGSTDIEFLALVLHIKKAY